jgi:hypothetical protein
MKSTSNRLVQLLKKTSPLALIALAVSLSQTASAQLLQVTTATFTDVGTSNQPPVPGPNDIYQTNISSPVTTANGNFSPEDNNFASTSTLSGMAGQYFVTGGNPAGYTVTNFAFELSPLGYTSGSTGPAGAYTVSGPNTWVQPWLLNFYQISGTTDPSGLGSNALLIASVLTTPGSFTNLGDWLNIGNLNIPLAPNTTNAWTVGIFSNGAGYCPLLMEVNNNGVGEPYTGLGGGAQMVAPAGPILVLAPGIAASQGNPETAPGGASNVVNYGVGVLTAVGNAQVTNCDMVFDIGITPGFVPPTITTNPIGDKLYSGNFNGQHSWFLYSAGVGPTNAPYGLNGYWQHGVTNVANGPTNWTLLANGGDVTITTTVTNYAFQAASVGSTVVLSGMTISDQGAYRFIITNSANGVTINSSTSAVVTITPYPAPAGSYAAVAISLGADAYWPLDERVDPSTEKAFAYDIIGGFNGWYGNNANNAGGNAANGYAPTTGPSSPGYAGFPTNNGAYGGMQNSRPYTYIIVSNMPTLSTPNVTWTGWINPINNPPANGNGVGIFMKRSGTYGANGGTDGIEFSSTTQLGYHWAPDGATSYNSFGPAIPSGVWSMIAVVIQPGFAQLYVCNTNNGLQLVTTNNTGIATETMGPNSDFAFGADEGNSNPGRTFVGYESAFAMFPSSLTVAQIAQLYDAGLALGNQVPIIATQPLTSYKFLISPSGKNITLPLSAFGAAPTNGAYWQKNSGSGWSTVVVGGDVLTGASITNVILTNIVLNLVINNVGLGANYGAFAYYPLNETADPSLPPAEAFELLGGLNGTYGTNSQDGPNNSFINSYSNGLYRLNNVPGLAGVPSTATALGSLQNVAALPNTYVTVNPAPTFPTSGTNSTNATIVAWVYPNLFSENASAGLVFERASGNVNGLCYANGQNSLGYTWDNNNAATYNYNPNLYIPSNTWSMVAVAVSPSNSVFYVANTVEGLITNTQNMINYTNATISTNSPQAWGGSMAIGTDTSGIPGRNFGGYISSVMFFSNTLSYAQIAALYDAGLQLGSQTPYFTQQPLSAKLIPGYGTTATFIAVGYGGTLTNGGIWQANYGSGWVNLANAVANNGGGIASGVVLTNTNSVQFSSTLVISGVVAADYGQYRFAYTNANGVGIISSVASLSGFAAPADQTSYLGASLLNTSLGLVAYWPLNDTAVDPSSGTNVAYDVVGGFNGLYGINAANGHANASNSFAANPGPGAAGLPGFPAGDTSLGSLQNTKPNTFVTTFNSPVVPAATTNLTLVAWIKPSSNEVANTGLLMQRTPTQVDGLRYSGTANDLGYVWANGGGVVGPNVPTNSWSMVAAVLTATNSTVYVGSSNAVILSTINVSNAFQSWGGPLSIGGDPNSNPLTLSFGGSESSVAMFTNALTTAQIEALYVAGQDAGNIPAPVITANPPTPAVLVYAGLNVTLSAAGFGILPAGGYWQRYSANGGSGWVTLTNAGVAGGTNANISGANTSLIGTLQNGLLVISNVSQSDVGSYRLVVTNIVGLAPGSGAATSTVVTLSVATAPVANSFAAALTNASYGTVAFWPLNETGDASTGTVVAEDYVGGYNGFYGTNAQNGGINTVLQTAGGPNYLGSVQGPAAAGLLGFPAGGALGSLQHTSLLSTFVNTVATPTFSTANATFVAWINPQTNEATGTGLMFMRSGSLGATRTDGLNYGTNNSLGYDWDNNNATTYGFNSALVIPTNKWSMVALVITNTTNFLYVGTNMNGTNLIVRSAMQNVTNGVEPWGAGMSIGGDPGNNPTNLSFGGYISSVAIFNKSLTLQQIQTLFNIGETNITPPPVIITDVNKKSAELLAGVNGRQGATFTVTATGYGTQPATGFWQVNNGSGWVTATNYYGFTGGTNAALVNTFIAGTLSFTNFQASNAGQYQFVVTNNGTGQYAVSSVVTISAYVPAANGYASVANTPGYGLMALWPLNEASDASTGTVVAYDVINGFNGLYRTNAQNGAPNNATDIAGTGAFPAGSVLSAFGPGAAGLAGFNPGDSALGTINNKLPQGYVQTQSLPTFPAGTTNATLIAWIYPNTNNPGAQGILVMRSGTVAATATDGLAVANAANTLGYIWDNNAAGPYNSFGPKFQSNVWSMVAVVITQSTNYMYVASTNGLQSVALYAGTTNNYQAWGTGGATIGGDPGGGEPGRTFGGYISSVSMFSNSLNVGQIENLFAAGYSAGNQAPIFVAQPSPLYQLLGGNILTINATAYGGTNCNGYWITNSGSGWFPLTNGGVISGATNTVTNGVNQIGSLVISTVSAANACSYALVMTNSWNGGAVNVSTSATAVVQIIAAPAASSFAGTLLQPGYNAVAYWPLGETGDPSAAQVTAFDIVGGFNGTYGYYAQDGSANAALSALTGGTAGNSGVVGPGAIGYTGLPSTAYASINALNAGTLITVPSSPSFPTNNTNVSIILWFNVNPTTTAGLTAYPNGYCDLFMSINGYLGDVTGNNGVQFNINSGQLQLAYDWDNDLAAAHTWVSGAPVPGNTWSMYGLVISPSNAVLYLGNTTNGLTVVTNPVANISIPWGCGFQIGGAAAGYPGSAANPNGLGNFFNGAISSAAMFATNLSVAQIESLYDAGIASGTNMPVVSVNPFPSYQLLTNSSVSIIAKGYTGPGGGGFWQKSPDGSTWSTVNVGGHVASVTVTPAGTLQQVSLNLTNVDGSDIAYYQCVMTNAGSEMVNGIRAVSSMTSLTTLPNPPTNSFAAVATSPGYGLVALWPLDDYVDATTNPPAYDVWGGWNGTYGVAASTGFPPSGYTIGTTGPGTSINSGIYATNYLGFALDQNDGLGDYYDAALGTTNGAANSTVKTLASPTFAANNTNMSIVAWIYPMTPLQATGTGLVFMRSAGQVDGLAYGAASSLADTWNGVAGPASFLTPPQTNWSMVAFVNTATNSTLYLCTTNEGIQSVPQVVSNAYQSWGLPLAIGGDPGTDPGLTFNGSISSVAIFSNALSQLQIGYLFAGGVGLGVLPPIIATQPNPTVVYQGRNATFNVIASGVGAIHYQWFQGTTAIANQTNATLVLSNYNGSGSYYVKVTDNYGTLQATSVNSTINTATTVAASTNAYVTNVLAQNPVAYYRLNEAVGATNAFDYWGGYVGVYGSAVTAGIVQGPTQLAFPLSAGFDANNLSADFTNAFVQGIYQGTPTEYNSQITIPALNINSNAMTITMWINPNEAQAFTNGLLYCRGAGTIAGFGFGTNAGGSLGYNWNNVAGTYNWSSGLVPAPAMWNFVALVITPTNGTIYCYNSVSQSSAVNQVTNATQLWASPATIGDDLFLATGARQFDGAIDEVAIFNKSLTVDQINKMFTVGTGIPIPAVIQTPITGQTNYVNAGTVTYTVGAVNGPLFYQWAINGVVITNGNNGYAETFSGATNASLTISNYSGDLAALPLTVSITNLTSTPPATSATTLPNLFPTPAQWTVNISLSNSVAWGGATGTTTGYQGYGIIGTGTSWNQIGGVAAGYAGVLTNYSAHNDTGSIADTGVRLVVTTGNVYESPTPWNSTLFDPFVVLPATSANAIVVTNLTPGFYNLFIYSLNGSWGWRGTTFTVGGVSSSANNGVTQTVDQAPYLGTNTAVFTNVFTKTGTITIANTPSTTAYLGGGNVAGESDFNGISIQLISPFHDLAVTQTGTNATLTWQGGILVSAPVLGGGTWTPVAGAVSPYLVPSVPSGGAVFYRLQEGVTPSIPPIPAN